MDIVAWICAVGACLWVLWWMLNSEGRKFRKFEAEVRARSPISEQDFERHYLRCEDVPTDVVLRVRQVFARFTGIPAEKILPDDDFHLFVDDNEWELMDALEQEFAIKIPDSQDVAKLRPTVRSVSMVLAKVVLLGMPGDVGKATK